MPAKAKTLHEKLVENFSYDADSGTLKRTTKSNGNGSLDKYGYLIIKFEGRQYKSHRLVWLLYYGEWPKYNVDHINGDRVDNRINNLRDVPQSENNRNVKEKKNKDTGVHGVYFDRTKGLKKNYAVRSAGMVHRFYTVDEAVDFRKTLPVRVIV